ncbi:MAG: circularly permuted type 2 ATP-grasp protein [Acidimicrobiia bacterium]
MSPIKTESLIAGYRIGADRHDEMLTVGGGVRPHWTQLAASIETLGRHEMLRRRHEITLLLEQDGATYNTGEGRVPWKVDPLPMVITSEEWRDIERGVVQRAELFDLLLADLYGRRRLLSSDLPPELILSDPAFLRSCDGITIPGHKQLFIYGVDLVRGPDDRWLALGNRTQAPSGAGYALTTRRVVSSVFPSLFRNADVHRLAPYIRSLRAGLQSVAPATVDDPAIVVLSPGPWAETAYEHALVATELGYPLVEGSDLQVRDGRVWLRTVGEPVRVDVILRRVDAWFCDPLELRPDSTLGVAGLVEACRTGAVTVVNTLGSGILENAGLAALLPGLCRRLLGEELLLPAVESWWCGDDAALSQVVGRLDQLVMRPVSRALGGTSIDGSELTADQRSDLAARISAAPWQWVAQERMLPATAPVLTDTGFEPRAAVVRTFAVAREQSYAAMTGGLTRVAASADSSMVTNTAGAVAKDTWVLASEPETLTGFWVGAGPRPVPVVALSARAAENLFWMGRYAERAEWTVRLLRIAAGRRNEFEHAPPGPGREALRALLRAVTRATATYPGFTGHDADAMLDHPGDELFSLMVDARRPGSVAHSVEHLLGAIDAVRDQLSMDTWLVVGALTRELEAVREPSADRDESLNTGLSRMMQGLLALSGLASESMVRDQAWHFMDLGRRIERGLQIATVLVASLSESHDAPTESLILESTLTAGESIITYRRRYRSRAQVATALDLLLSDPGNPRSLRYQLDRMAEDLVLLKPSGETSTPVLVLEAAAMLAAADTVALGAVDASGIRVGLSSFVASMTDVLRRTAVAVGGDNFARMAPQQSILTPAEMWEGDR